MACGGRIRFRVFSATLLPATNERRADWKVDRFKIRCFEDGARFAVSVSRATRWRLTTRFSTVSIVATVRLRNDCGVHVSLSTSFSLSVSLAIDPKTKYPLIGFLPGPDVQSNQ